MTKKDYELYLWILDNLVTDKPESYVRSVRSRILASIKRLER
jgi:hypothetical protein